REGFLRGTLDVVARWPCPAELVPADPAGEDLEGRLLALVAPALGIEPSAIDVNQPLTRYGTDSSKLAEIVCQIETRFGAHLPLEGWLGGASIAGVLPRLRRLMRAPAPDGPKETPPAAAPPPPQRSGPPAADPHSERLALLNERFNDLKQRGEYFF